MDPTSTDDTELDAILGEWAGTQVEVLDTESDAEQPSVQAVVDQFEALAEQATAEIMDGDSDDPAELSDDPVGPEQPAESTEDKRTDRVLGMIVGAALGSAVALPFHSRNPWVLRDNKEATPSNFAYPSGQLRRGYPADDWTGTVDHLILLMRASVAADYENTPVGRQTFTRGFASKLHGWSNQGFPALGDALGTSFDGITETAIKDPNFTARTHAPPAGCALGSPIVRAIALARLGEEHAHLTAWATAQTHNNKQAIGGACVVTQLLRSMIHSPDLTAKHLTDTFNAAMTEMGKTQGRAMCKSILAAGSLELIDYETHPASAEKTVQTAAWAYRQLLKTPEPDRDGLMFQTLVNAVAHRGRNAAVNAAVTGAVLGAAVGYRGLPKQWTDGMPNKKWLVAEVKASLA